MVDEDKKSILKLSSIGMFPPVINLAHRVAPYLLQIRHEVGSLYESLSQKTLIDHIVGVCSSLLPSGYCAK